MLHEEFEIPEELPHPLPSPIADLDLFTTLVCTVGNIGDQAFLIERSRGLTQRAHADGQDRKKLAAGLDRSSTFVQEIEHLNLELPKIDAIAGIANCPRELSIRLDLLNSRARGVGVGRCLSLSLLCKWECEGLVGAH